MKNFIILVVIALLIVWVTLSSQIKATTAIAPEAVSSVSNNLRNSIELDDLLVNRVYSLENTLCDNYIKPIDEFDSWKQESLNGLKHYYQSLSTKEVSSDIVDFISLYSGVGVLKGRQLLIQEEDIEKFVHPLLNYDNLKLEESDELSTLSTHISDKDSSKILELLLKKTKKENNLIVLNYKKSTVFSHLLESNLPDIEYIIRSLIEHGYMASHIDLQTSTKLGLPSYLIELLVSSMTKFEPKLIINNGGIHESFLTIAVKSNKPELVQFWLENESPATPDKFNRNALDELKPPKSGANIQSQIDIYNLLVNHGIKPNKKITNSKLKRWLPKDLYDSFKVQISTVNELKPSKESIPVIVNNVIHLYKSILKDRLNTDGSDNIINKCFIKNGKKLLKSILYSKNIRKKVKLNKFLTIEHEVNNLKLSIDTKTVSLNQIIEEYPQNSLKNKLLFDTIALEKLKLQSEERDNIFSDDENDFNESKFDEFIENANSKNWDKAVESLNESINEKNKDSASQSKLDTLLIVAISTNQTWDTIKNLLNDGANLNNGIVFILARGNNTDLAKNLLNYGLDLNAVDALGKNAIYHSVLYGTYNMLSFLVSKQVDIDFPYSGKNPLDLALQLVKYNQEQKPIIDLLMSNDIKVRLSHKERTQTYRLESPLLYEYLVTSYPNLK